MANRKRTKEERIAEIDEKITNYSKKIENYQEKIKTLTEKRENILNPKPRNRKRKLTFNTITAIAKEQGMSLEDFADKLGVEIDSYDFSE